MSLLVDLKCCSKKVIAHGRENEIGSELSEAASTGNNSCLLFPMPARYHGGKTRPAPGRWNSRVHLYQMDWSRPTKPKDRLIHHTQPWSSWPGRGWSRAAKLEYFLLLLPSRWKCRNLQRLKSPGATSAAAVWILFSYFAARWTIKPQDNGGQCSQCANLLLSLAHPSSS